MSTSCSSCVAEWAHLEWNRSDDLRFNCQSVLTRIPLRHPRASRAALGSQSLEVGLSHCSSTPSVQPAEAFVPIFTITSEPNFKHLLATEAALGFGRFSHFEIFPTLLLAMGFDKSWVNKIYGPSLIDPPSLHREFLIGSPAYQPMVISADRNWAR